jgi:hypothetical protein
MKLSQWFKPMGRIRYCAVSVVWLVLPMTVSELDASLGWPLGGVADDSILLGVGLPSVWAALWSWPIFARLADLKWSWLWGLPPVALLAWGIAETAANIGGWQPSDGELGSVFPAMGGMLVFIPFALVVGAAPAPSNSRSPWQTLPIPPGRRL